jgi:hypothetical protein
MQIGEKAHLSYCTNIHPGETWTAVFESLKKYCIAIQHKLVPDKPFGIGLRLSKISASQLLENNQLKDFKNWLDTNNLYVFTMNGFPYGNFHNVVIKDQVHTPDWTTKERVDYTLDLIKILSVLLPEGLDGGISTSPLSYKLWFNGEEELIRVKRRATQSLVDVLIALIKVKEESGKTIHIDIEPEPDGMLENTQEVVDYYSDYLLKEGVSVLRSKTNCSAKEAAAQILEHLQLCYDVCHFALAYEYPKEVIKRLNAVGIKVGKIQISAALRCEKSIVVSIREQQKCLEQFNEPTYLHQAVVLNDKDELQHFSDLKEGITAMNNPDFKEIRTHFHVPVFVSDFQVLESTQNDIIETLHLWKEEKFTNHLEVETYTWGVLPEHLQTDMTSSIVRELAWVQKQLK